MRRIAAVRMFSGQEWCMSRLLEILGRAITVNTADLIWHWFAVAEFLKNEQEASHYSTLGAAVELAAQGKIDDAEEQLRLYLFENASCPYGRLAAAAICIQKNHLHNAIEELNSVYMRQPSNTMALYALGHCYERLGKEAEAIEFYQDCLKFKNYLQLPKQRLGAIYFKNGQIEKTITEYEQLKQEYPDDLLTLLMLGYLYITTRDYERAVDTFNTAILIHPDNFQETDDEINQLIYEGQIHEALDRIEQLLTEQAARPDMILKHADLLAMLGADKEAAAEYEQAIHICPDFLEANIKLGSQYLKLGHDALAAQQYNRAVEINDQIVDAYIGLAITKKLAAKTSDAIATLSLAAAIQANSSLLFAETATLQFKLRLDETTSSDTQDSPELFESVITAHTEQIKQRPQNPELRYRLGVLMMSVGRITDAIRAFQTAVEINPTYCRARNKLAVCLFEADQKQAALEQVPGPECIDRDTLELHYRTALLYCDRAKFASSLANLERHMQQNFTSTDAAVNISIVLQNLGLLDRAAATWNSLAHTTQNAIDTRPPSSQT